MNAAAELESDALQKMAALVGREGVAELIQGFLNDLTPQRAAFDAAVQRDDLAQAGRVLHNLKSSSFYLGATAFSQLCGTLETAARKGDHAALRAQRVDVVRRLQCIGDELRQLVLP